MNGQSTIAIIGWGSLIWDPRDLEIHGSWQDDGPFVDLEFCRIAGNGRLTLVINERYGVPCGSYYALSSKRTLNEAIENIRVREGTVEKHIGFIDFRLNTSSNHRSLPRNIRDWGSGNGFDAVIWTALPSNFYDRRRQDFSVTNAIGYLNELSGATKDRALEYLRNAPDKVRTPLRTKLAELELI